MSELNNDTFLGIFRMSTSQIIILGVFVFICCGVNIFIASNVYNNIQNDKRKDAMKGIAVLKVSTIIQLILILMFSFLFWNSQDKARFSLQIFNICLCVVFTVTIAICLNKLFKMQKETLTDSEVLSVFHILIAMTCVFAFGFICNFLVVGSVVYLETTSSILNSLQDIPKLSAAAAEAALLQAKPMLSPMVADILKEQQPQFDAIAKSAGDQLITGAAQGAIGLIPKAFGGAKSGLYNATVYVGSGLYKAGSSVVSYLNPSGKKITDDTSTTTTTTATTSTNADSSTTTTTT